MKNMFIWILGFLHEHAVSLVIGSVGVAIFVTSVFIYRRKTHYEPMCRDEVETIANIFHERERFDSADEFYFVCIDHVKNYRFNWNDFGYEDKKAFHADACVCFRKHIEQAVLDYMESKKQIKNSTSLSETLRVNHNDVMCGLEKRLKNLEDEVRT